MHIGRKKDKKSVVRWCRRRPESVKSDLCCLVLESEASICLPVSDSVCCQHGELPKSKFACLDYKVYAWSNCLLNVFVWLPKSLPTTFSLDTPPPSSSRTPPPSSFSYFLSLSVPTPTSPAHLSPLPQWASLPPSDRKRLLFPLISHWTISATFSTLSAASQSFYRVNLHHKKETMDSKL